MESKAKGGKAADNLGKIIISVLAALICITINSKNSFLYNFNDSMDIQQFVTAVRCILRGDVLYRDIYEVKGPILYFIYYIGSLINENIFLGTYVIEILLFSVYVFFNFKITELFTQNKYIQLISVLSSAYISTVTQNMFGGGQCEELMLFTYSLTFYISLRYFKNTYPKRINPFDVIGIGLLFGIVFWVKYALCGLFLGLVIFIIAVQIKDKTFGNIFLYAGLFLFGFVLCSIPIFCYFIKHNAVDSLFEVYFYDMIFTYKPDNEQSVLFFFEKYFTKCIAADIFIPISLVYTFFAPQNRMNNHMKYGILSMELAGLFGICCSRVWRYSPEILHAFSIFGILAVFFVIYDSKEYLIKLWDKFSEYALRLTKTGSKGIMCLLPLMIVLLCVTGEEKAGYTAVYILLTCCLTVLLSFISEKIMKKSVKIGITIKYLLFIVIAVSVKRYIPIIGHLPYYLLAVIAAADIMEYKENILSFINRYKEKYKTKFKAGRLFFPACVLSLFLLFNSSSTNSAVALDIGAPLESYVPYVASQYILSSDIENPSIINFDILETGILWFTNGYPSTRNISTYNIDNSDYSKNQYPKIYDQTADFIVTMENITFEGYTCVYALKRDYIIVGDYPNEENVREFYFYAKNSIYEENCKNNIYITDFTE